MFEVWGDFCFGNGGKSKAWFGLVLSLVISNLPRSGGPNNYFLILNSVGPRREAGGHPANQSSDIQTPGKKDVHFRRISSGSDDTDVSEPSFIDMLKSNAKKPVQPESAAAAGASELSEGSQASRSAKKKVKKGKQIDPALLGFKVTSNRIMMGEIQRVDD